jgi:hypothetical protein
MQDLHVLAVENGALLAVSEGGERFRIPIDGVLQAKLREAQPSYDSGRRLSPREIQAKIRSGLSAEEVADATGVPIDYVRRFEGPVLAERQYIVTTALAVPVRTALESGSEASTFGGVIEERLETAQAAGIEWAAWKDHTGAWVLRVVFTADRVEHDARWTFDPKKQTLSPSNAEAVTLSQQGDAAGVLIPRLRAVGMFDKPTDTSRFDSGAFVVESEESVEITVTETAELEDAPHSQTADLLEALRRRRGEREAAVYDEEPHPVSDHPSTGIRLVEVPIEEYFESDPEPAVAPEPEPAPASWTAPQPAAKSRRGRVSMPSWDDIVFGTKPDDDLA